MSEKENWIYESPDGGKTVFRRPFSDYNSENKEEIDWETKKPTGRKFSKYPFKQKIVWTNGCFDILHKGHIELFKYAKSFGDLLYVGIDKDEKVKADKGLNRPHNNQKDRKMILESIKYIDKVFMFNDKEDLESLIKMSNPDVMVIGSDWRNKKVVGEQYTKKLVFFDRIPKHSTTETLKWLSQK